MQGEYLDVVSDVPTTAGAPGSSPAALKRNRRFLGIHYTCCDVYSRIYINGTGSFYEGRCPRCGKSLLIRIGEGGVSSRFFAAG